MISSRFALTGSDSGKFSFKSNVKPEFQTQM